MAEAGTGVRSPASASAASNNNRINEQGYRDDDTTRIFNVLAPRAVGPVGAANDRLWWRAVAVTPGASTSTMATLVGPARTAAISFGWCVAFPDLVFGGEPLGVAGMPAFC